MALAHSGSFQDVQAEPEEQRVRAAPRREGWGPGPLGQQMAQGRRLGGDHSVRPSPACVSRVRCAGLFVRFLPGVWARGGGGGGRRRVFKFQGSFIKAAGIRVGSATGLRHSGEIHGLRGVETPKIKSNLLAPLQPPPWPCLCPQGVWGLPGLWQCTPEPLGSPNTVGFPGDGRAGRGRAQSHVVTSGP